MRSFKVETTAGGVSPEDAGSACYRDPEHGAVLVEGAFIMTLLLMLLMGTITSAVAYSKQTSLQTASREASRYGAARPVESNMSGWLNGVLDVAKASANKDLAPTAPNQTVCVAYVYPNGTSANDRTTRLVESGGVKGSPIAGAKEWCFDDGRPDDERRVQVLVGRRATIQAAIFSMDVDLKVPTVARFERAG